MLQFKIGGLIFFLMLGILLNSCQNSVKQSNDNLLKFRCIPYAISNEKTNQTYLLEAFGRIVSEVNAEIIYHVLPDKSMTPYITLEGHKDIIERMEWVVKYNNLYNQNELQIKYSKCIIKNRNRLVKIQVYGHELFEVKIKGGTFISTDTIRSNVGKLSLYDAGECCFNVVCNVPILLMDLTSVSFFVINGMADSCVFYIRPDGGKAPGYPSNLRNFQYKSLYFMAIAQPYWRDESNSIINFAGRPERITYFVDRPEFKLYYQGNPEIISTGSPYDPLILEP